MLADAQFLQNIPRCRENVFGAQHLEEKILRPLILRIFYNTADGLPFTFLNMGIAACPYLALQEIRINLPYDFVKDTAVCLL